MNVIVPVEQTKTTVTLNRADYEAIIERLEDAADREAIRRSEADLTRLGEEEHRRLCYLAEETRRIVLDDVAPLTIWRERAGLSQRALGVAAEVSPSYLAEIESGKKPGSASALSRIAKALRVPMEFLVG